MAIGKIYKNATFLSTYITKLRYCTINMIYFVFKNGALKMAGSTEVLNESQHELIRYITMTPILELAHYK
jgi:hypothetical protein